MVPMANIVPSDLHPDEEVRYGLGGYKAFKLAPGGSHSTDDREAIAQAQTHPWLAVEYDETEEAVAVFRPLSVEPKDDHLSAYHANEAFDPKAVERDRNKVLGLDDEPVAIESGTKQTKEVSSGPVAETLAAADAVKDNDAKTGEKGKA